MAFWQIERELADAEMGAHLARFARRRRIRTQSPSRIVWAAIDSDILSAVKILARAESRRPIPPTPPNRTLRPRRRHRGPRQLRRRS